jgi:quercetin dioxygenase-like cupin family protein
MANVTIDERNIRWQQLDGFNHFHYYIFDVNRQRKTVDFLVKFDANETIPLHRHVSLNHMLVIRGEHRLYKPDGELKEVRPAGRYTVSPADQEPHLEGGGNEDVIILFSVRGTDGTMYEILDDAHNTIGTLGMDEFEALYAAQDTV